MRRTSAGLASLLLVPALALLTACATSSAGGTIPEPAPDTPEAAQVEASTAPAEPRYAATATIIQQPGEEPQACFGAVLTSLPPQCGGPVVVGLDWADVPDAETLSDVTWGAGWVVGVYDADDFTFTLTEPVREDPPDGMQPPDPRGDLPGALDALCEDPWRGGDESAPSPNEMPLHERAAQLPGFITTYVSDGSTHLNVLLTRGSDVEAAHASLREVWPGWLCVGAPEHDGPSQDESFDAMEALGAALDQADHQGVLGSGANATRGTFSIQVILADDATRTLVEDALAPWYSPEQIVISSTLTPVL
ncbi:hypothetical protein [Salana multivorans]